MATATIEEGVSENVRSINMANYENAGLYMEAVRKSEKQQQVENFWKCYDLLSYQSVALLKDGLQAALDINRQIAQVLIIIWLFPCDG